MIVHGTAVVTARDRRDARDYYIGICNNSIQEAIRGTMPPDQAHRAQRYIGRWLIGACILVMLSAERLSFDFLAERVAVPVTVEEAALLQVVVRDIVRNAVDSQEQASMFAALGLLLVGELRGERRDLLSDPL
jgi:hypothetical protein